MRTDSVPYLGKTVSKVIVYFRIELAGGMSATMPNGRIRRQSELSVDISATKGFTLILFIGNCVLSSWAVKGRVRGGRAEVAIDPERILVRVTANQCAGYSVSCRCVKDENRKRDRGVNKLACKRLESGS